MTERANTEKIISLMRTDDSIDAPAERIDFVKKAFLSFGPRPVTLVERIRSVLAIDLAAGQPAYGERSANGGTSRQLLFDAGDAAIDVRISDLGGAFYVYGQIVTDTEPTGTITIIGNGFDRTAEIDANGRFDLGQVAAGTYSIETTGTLNIDAGPIVIG